MAKVVWDRREEIANAWKPIPYTPRDSFVNFKPPAQIESDFTRLLNHEVKHINWTFELVHDWYYLWSMSKDELDAVDEAELKRMYQRGTRYIRLHPTGFYDEYGNAIYDTSHFGDGVTEITYYALNEDGTYEETDEYKPKFIRAQQTPIDWKSKIGNSDMSTNFKTDYKELVQKGDMVIREDGTLYMLNWNITNHANNQATQSVELNAVVDITREFPDTVDEKAMLIEEGGRRAVCPTLPISHSEYAGRPDYSGASGQAGMHPDHLITVYCQWNTATRKIRLDDEFIIGDFTYRVINISLAEVQVDKDYGVLTLNAKRVAGGAVDGGE